MEKQNLTITLSGGLAAGKSRLTYLLREFLIEKGFDIEQEFYPDHPTKNNFDKIIGRELDNAIDAIKDKTKIKLVEVQVNRYGI